MPRPLPRCPPGFTDHVFGTVHGVPLPLRVWPPTNRPGAGPSGGKGVPWLLWVHGGGYTCGKYTAPTPWIAHLRTRGYAIASVGYRLQPHASFADMLADVLLAASWCRTHLPRLVGADPLAPVYAGASSGATLAAAAALVAPPPRAVVSVYGLVDLWRYRAEERARDADASPYLVASEAEMAELFDAAGREELKREASVQNPWAEEFPPHVPLEEARAVMGDASFTPSEDHLRRVDMYTFVARHRNLVDTICRRNAYAADDEFEAAVKAVSPFQQLGKDGGSYPPTFFMHGTNDSVVGPEHSREMAGQLREMGVAVGEHYEEGAGHTYDFALESPEDPGWKENVEACIDFMDKHVKSA